MGIDIGFDMVPRLSNSELDAKKWKAFLDQIEQQFKTDSVFSKTPKFFEFKVGEHPRLTIEPQKFCRFSSKVTGNSEDAEIYIDQVFEIAKKHFGDQVRFWNDEAGDEYYSWDEVQAVQTYD